MNNTKHVFNRKILMKIEIENEICDDWFYILDKGSIEILIGQNLIKKIENNKTIKTNYLLHVK